MAHLLVFAKNTYSVKAYPINEEQEVAFKEFTKINEVDIMAQAKQCWLPTCTSLGKKGLSPEYLVTFLGESSFTPLPISFTLLCMQG
jgi:hypothetical protein